MRSLHLIIVVLFGFLASQLAHADLTSAATRPGLTIQQRNGAVTAKVGGLGFSDSGFGTAIGEAQLKSEDLPTLMPAFNPGTVHCDTIAVSIWILQIRSVLLGSKNMRPIHLAS